MPAPKGNQFWKLRNKHGRDKLFKSAELLWEAACEYFEWVDKNPLKEQKAFSTKSGIQTTNLNLMRPYTITGLCLYLGCNQDYFNQFESNLSDKDKDFSGVITRIRETIYTQKFEGAACNLLNANIIARDLGLKDKQEHEHTGKDGKDLIPIENLSAKERTKLISLLDSIENE